MKIRLQNMVFYAFHGVHPAEQKLGQRFVVNICVNTDNQLDKQIKHLGDTVDYTKIYDDIAYIMQNNTFELLELCCNKIIETILSKYTLVTMVNIRIKKPAVPIQGILDCAEVEMERQRPC